MPAADAAANGKPKRVEWGKNALVLEYIFYLSIGYFSHLGNWLILSLQFKRIGGFFLFRLFENHYIFIMPL